MDSLRIRSLGIVPVVLLVLSSCAQGPDLTPVETRPASEIADDIVYGDKGRPKSTFLDLFRERPDFGQIGSVNKYLWNASLEVLNFLPVQSVDPFTGVITTGFGTPPGGGRSYRATILVSDPALDARSLNISIQTQSGPADAATVRAVEDAILTRARQLREADSRF
ncbi:DUF3576 domain-containing protein [Puniceibacterium sp. IMCC21224]|uniref:DUF3576 domain-containing protein n=1 Tax=Puniceibacterium sp. IMCC21224 TaxID=1618204 RepID=UPI00064DB083|nr:DUF3576 domain-containing protein [Puniceibacterium sp. IMCC21224]KMK68739.1 protein of unknown function (DUF3576) [Puniceibacterium sp. IMCC21224]